MIISHNQVEAVLNLYKATSLSDTKNKVRDKESPKPTGGCVGKPDQITLSDEFLEYRIAREALSRVPEVREQKVAEIKKMIQEGNYIIDGTKVAEKIVERHIVDRLV